MEPGSDTSKARSSTRGADSQTTAQHDLSEIYGPTRQTPVRALESYDDASRMWRSLPVEDHFVILSTLTRKFSFAIPTSEALHRIADFVGETSSLGIVEIGAGSGYWARNMAERGVNVLAFDHNPWPEPWTEVTKGDLNIAGNFPDHVLMLCCPPAGNPKATEYNMASLALKAYQEAGGRSLIFVGEREFILPHQVRLNFSKTGDLEFHRMLTEQWQNIDRVRIPNWPLWRNEVHLLRLANQVKS